MKFGVNELLDKSHLPRSEPGLTRPGKDGSIILLTMTEINDSYSIG